MSSVIHNLKRKLVSGRPTRHEESSPIWKICVGYEVDQISSGSVPQISPHASCDDVGSQDKNRFVVE